MLFISFYTPIKTTYKKMASNIPAIFFKFLPKPFE